jgi:single-stranded DNA-binding protein|nr:MAG TPA: Single strand binding protein [Caudoviricetes sp.]
MENAINNNNITLAGVVEKEPEYSHEVLGEGFYVFMLKCSRTSGNKDTLPVMISDGLTDIREIKVGQVVTVSGQIRSFNRHIDDVKSKLILSVFARELKILTQDATELSFEEDINTVILDGFVCKPPIYRCTPKGREIADILVAVNRPYGKSDYIPCIAWGRNARFAGGLEVGEHIRIQGRFQSREYAKKISDNEIETRVAYEVSVSRIDYAEEGKADE